MEMEAPQQKKKGEKLADALKELFISEPHKTTHKGTVKYKVEDPALVAKWPKLRTGVRPIFLHKPANFREHAIALLKMGVKFYQPYVTVTQTKISCPTNSDHKSITQYFDKNKLPYHTFGIPSRQKMKVVIRGLPDDTDLDIVKEELKAVFIPIIRLHKMHAKIGSTTPILTLAVVPHNENGRKLLAVKKILGHAVTFEPPKPRVKQCHRCQKWSHSQRYCHGTIKCVKCAGNHMTNKCKRDPSKEPVKCANCNREHTANYTGCPSCPDSDEHRRTVRRKLIAATLSKVSKAPPKLASLDDIDHLYRKQPTIGSIHNVVEELDDLEQSDDEDHS